MTLKLEANHGRTCATRSVRSFTCVGYSKILSARCERSSFEVMYIMQFKVMKCNLKTTVIMQRNTI